MLTPEIEKPYSPGEVAAKFGVNVRTVRRWCDADKLPHFRTPGGHVRMHRADIDALLEGSLDEAKP